MRCTPSPPSALRYTGRVDTRVLPSPVFISADPTEVERGAAHQLHVVVTLADHPRASLAGDGEGLDQQVVERLAVGEALAELGGLGLQLGVGERLELGFERVDLGHQRLQSPDLFAFTSAKELVENAHETDESTGGVRGEQPRPGRIVWVGRY